MIYKISEIDRPRLKEVYEKAMKDLGDFFQINWQFNRPYLILVPDGKTIDSLRGEKTENWLVGWERKGNVYLLDDKKFADESDHEYSDQEYFALMKHELAHCFSETISNFSQKPKWLLEGVSIYLSGQTKFKTKPEKLKKFIDFFDEGGKGIYSEAGFAVMFLVEKYGKEKLLTLLKECKQTDTQQAFADLFKSIYGFELSYDNFS